MSRLTPRERLLLVRRRNTSERSVRWYQLVRSSAGTAATVCVHGVATRTEQFANRHFLRYQVVPSVAGTGSKDKRKEAVIMNVSVARHGSELKEEPFLFMI